VIGGLRCACPGIKKAPSEDEALGLVDFWVRLQTQVALMLGCSVEQAGVV
jgi:hypothetical protein